MAATGSILLLCHSFPPVYGIGGRRWAKFAKELARRGNVLNVLRSNGQADGRASLWNEDVQHPGIRPVSLYDRYPGVMRKWPLTHLGEKLAYRYWLAVLPLLTKGNYYDYGFMLRAKVLAEGRRSISENGITHVIATGAPFSFLRYAAQLKREFPHLRLIVDFRDEWASSEHYGMQSLSKQRRAQESLWEHEVVTAADRVISPSRSILEQLQASYPGAAERFVHIPHAVDPQDFAGVRQERVEDGIFRMIYAGSLYGGKEVDTYFEAVMDAFDVLRGQCAECLGKVRFDLYITGHDFNHFQERVARRGLARQIRFHAPLPSPEILQRIQAADLVVNYFPPDKKDVISTKFHEVFHLHRPILHVGMGGEVSRLLLERKLGDWLTVDQLQQELPRIIRGERKIEINPSASFDELLLPKVTDRLVNEVLLG